MALNIPNTDLPGTSLIKGLNTGGTLFSRMMQPILQREQQKRLAEQFAQEQALRNKTENRMGSQFEKEFGLRKQTENRLGQNAGLNRELIEQQVENWKHKNDPEYALKQLQKKLDFIDHMGKMGGQGGQPNSSGASQPMNQEQPNPNVMDMINQGQAPEEGQGAMMPQEQPQQQPMNPDQMQGEEQGQPQGQDQFQQTEGQNNQLPFGLNMDEIKRALAYQSLGLKVPPNGINKEPPQIKRMNDLRSKMEEAKYKHELKIAEEQTKQDLKNEATKYKTIESAKSDIPHLNETLRSLKVMKKIADDPKNDDMFGHWWLGHEKAAQRTTNPNAGIWQVEGLAPIVDAEMKMSSKGNIVALKSAQSNKPNFGEARSVAQSKLNAQIQQIERRIKDTEKIANNISNSNEEVKHLDGKTYKKIGGEWHEVN